MASEAFDEAACLARVRAGDPCASRELIHHLYPLVAKVVRAYLPRGHSAEDWQQEVFWRVFDRLAQFRGQAPLEHWVSRIAVNTCLDQLRARKTRELRWSDLNEGEAELLGASLTDRAEQAPGQALAARELVSRLLEGLKPEDRAVIQMLDLEEKSVAEAARLLGWTATGTKVRAFRARKRMRAMLERMLAEKGKD
jgi:RNA polymerase sigma-70 factor (ECF subfamily)